MRYWIGLGANLGDRLASLRAAADSLAGLGAVIARSRVFAASPVGGPPQPSFLNAAILLECPLPPRDLLVATQRIERELGRDRDNEVRWGPRTMDIDILLAGTRGELVVRDVDLVIPHARLHERAFALAPILDLEPTLLHPTLTRPLSALLSQDHGKHALAPTGETL